MNGDLCGEWMPKAKTTCALPEGHKSKRHRSAQAVARESERQKTPEYRKREREYNRERQKTPERREYMREYEKTPERRERNRERKKTPEYREYDREYMREYKKTPQYREYERERRKTPERREYERERRKTPERREYMRNRNANRRARKSTGVASNLPAIRAVLLLRDGNDCQICYTPLAGTADVDHALSLSKFGEFGVHEWWNLRLTHAPCNRSKRANVTAEAIDWLLRSRPSVVPARDFGILTSVVILRTQVPAAPGFLTASKNLYLVR